jgi:N-acetyl-anhydromuramyl-L-alanine amidase AmpD
MMTNYPQLPAHLRKWGLKVEEGENWRERGRPHTFKPKAVICHHTASGATSGNFGSSRVVTFGRSDLPGPLCHFLLGRDGTVRIISGNYANHAGTGGPRAGIPANLGNTYAWGIEAENNGIGEKWPKTQLNAYYRLCAALLDLMGTKDVSKVIGHKEWTSRKIDPAGIEMSGFRSQVKAALSTGPSVTSLSLTKLKKGKRNNDVLALKRRLADRGVEGLKMDNFYGSGLVNAVKEFQKKNKFEVQSGEPTERVLKKLGFNVTK